MDRACADETVTVKVDDALVPVTATEAGLKVAFTPGGSPAVESVTFPVNPYIPVTVTVYAAEDIVKEMV